MTARKLTLTFMLTTVAYLGTTSSVSQISLMPLASAASTLGDLSKFKKIAKDTELLIDKGDLVAAKKRIKDLEIIWDESEAGLKPRSASDWHLIDKGIDLSLSTLRTELPKQVECKKSIVELNILFNKVEGK